MILKLQAPSTQSINPKSLNIKTHCSELLNDFATGLGTRLTSSSGCSSKERQVQDDLRCRLWGAFMQLLVVPPFLRLSGKRS